MKLDINRPKPAIYKTMMMIRVLESINNFRKVEYETSIGGDSQTSKKRIFALVRSNSCLQNEVSIGCTAATNYRLLILRWHRTLPIILRPHTAQIMCLLYPPCSHRAQTQFLDSDHPCVLSSLLSNQNPSWSTGPDKVLRSLWKLLAPANSQPLANIFSFLLFSGQIPYDWHQEVIVELF